MKCVAGKIEEPGNLLPRCSYLCAIQHGCIIKRANETEVENFIHSKNEKQWRWLVMKCVAEKVEAPGNLTPRYAVEKIKVIKI